MKDHMSCECCKVNKEVNEEVKKHFIKSDKTSFTQMNQDRYNMWIARSFRVRNVKKDFRHETECKVIHTETREQRKN